MQDSNSIEVFYPNRPNPMLVDIENLPILLAFNGAFDKDGYLTKTVGKRRKKYQLKFYHKILKSSSGLTDHINGNILDNRRSNLRIANYNQNSSNRKKPIHGITSKYKGVRWHKVGRKFVAQIVVKYKAMHLGSFIIEEDAARAYDEAARKYFGDFGRYNFPKEGEQGI